MQRSLFYAAALVVAFSGAAHAKCPPGVDGTTIVGRLENVGIDEANTVLTARIDTGAGLSSLDARNIKVYKDPKGKQRVRFDVTRDDGKEITIRRPLIDWANIKLKASKKTPQGGTVKRPIVRLDLCLGGKVIEGRVNLADRSHMLYPLLIGRNTLKTGDYLINPKRKFMHKVTCGGH